MDGINEPNNKPFRDRRVSLKELRQTAARLKRQLRKEEKRAEKVRSLKKFIHELASQVNGYRNDPELR